MSHKVVVLDVDGVLVVPEEPFSWRYARDNGLDRALFSPFFQGEFQDTLIGKADLRQLLQANLHLWQWNDSVDELMRLWFESENIPNTPIIAAVRGLKHHGVARYFATNQEKYRAEYIRTRVFDNDLFDGDYVSADIGLKKPDPQFFQHVLDDLQIKHPGIVARDILLVDDTLEHVKSAKSLGFDAAHYNEQSAESIQQIIAEATN
jgi:putative hydrolase of the HAD superfamily